MISTLGPLALILLSSSYPSPIAQEAIDPDDVPTGATETIVLEQDRAKRMTVQVNIGEFGPFDFMIDTGSERTVLSRSIAGKLALEPAEGAVVMGVAGIKAVETVYVPDLTLGKQNYGEVVAPLLEGFHIGADGILGLDGLQDQRILFDFARNVIEVENVGTPSKASEYEIVVKARKRSGQLIFTDARIEGKRVEVIIDTGAQMSIGNLALQKALGRKKSIASTTQPTSLMSVTGQTMTADAAIASNFRIGDMTISNMALVFADSPPFEEFGLKDRPALLLGMETLRYLNRMAIDFKNRKVHFDLPR